MSDPLVLRDVRRTYRTEAGELAGAARRRPDAACRRDRRVGGTVGCRQVDAAASRRTAGKAGRRLGVCRGPRCRRAGRCRAHRDPARHDRLRLSVPSSAGRVHRAGECRAAADDRRQAAQGGRRARHDAARVVRSGAARRASAGQAVRRRAAARGDRARVGQCAAGAAGRRTDRQSGCCDRRRWCSRSCWRWCGRRSSLR